MASIQNADPPHLPTSETLPSATLKTSESVSTFKSILSATTTLPRKTLTEESDFEDGPLFRATIAQLESRTSALRMNVKRIIKAATASLEVKQASLEADEAFVQALRETPCVEPLISHYINATWPKTREQHLRLQHSMQSLLIDPLQQLYEHDVKVAEGKRKEFEEESKDYYAYLAKYLSIKKSEKSAESDAKHLTKKRHFDLRRFDYYMFLVDLHGGRKEQELLYHLLTYYQKQFAYQQSLADTVGPFKSGLDELANILADVSREQTVFNKERVIKRKILENKYTAADSTQANSEPPSQVQSATTDDPPISPVATDAVGLGISGAVEDKFRGIRDLEKQDRDLIVGSGRRKEGFLFATSKPIKNNTNAFDKASSAVWHKYWCVLSGGQLHEYSNWKSQLQSHIVPINLRFAAAREARNTDRRFCFEIITPQFRRVYQATSHEEMHSWIATVNNAIESLLNGMSSSIELANQGQQDPAQQQRLQEALAKKPSRRHARSLSGALRSNPSKDKHAKKRQANLLLDATEPNTGQAGNEPRFRWSGLGFGKANGASQLYTCSPIPDTVASTSLITQLRHDSSNALCADCGDANPEWCSLNLGIMLCIECSGIHRSLGTHISKVRSLTLDSTSYTPDIVALLCSIGNARANAIWDPRPTNDQTTDIPRIKPDDKREVKLKYIQAKYVDRAFVNKADVPNAQQLLFDAIERDDIPEAMRALALGANVNASRPSTMSPTYDVKSILSSLTPPNISPDTVHTYIAADSFLWNLDEDDHIPTDSDVEDMTRYPLHVALLHSRISLDNGERDQVFPMAEFLLQNGADTGIHDPTTGCTLAELVGLSNMVDDEAVEYLSLKNTARGQSPIARASMPPPTRPQIDLTSIHTTH